VYFLGGKGGWCVRLTTVPPSCAVVMKCGDLKFLELSGPLKACKVRLADDIPPMYVSDEM